MKNIRKILLILSVILLSACADSKTFKKSDGTFFVAEPYGWNNYQSKNIPRVTYEYVNYIETNKIHY